MRNFLVLGAVNGFLAVALGAFGAHGLEGQVSPSYLETWDTAVKYEMFHAAGLLVIGILLGFFKGDSLLKWSGRIMMLGIILFSGSLYVLVLTGVTTLGMITPLGGVSFLIAWTLLAVSAWKNAKQ